MLDKRNLTFSVGAFVIIMFIVFVSMTQVLGIPLWWVFRGGLPLGMIRFNEFDIDISPEAPTSIGDSVLVEVRNASSRTPVEEAKISVSKDGQHIFDYYTNSSGQAMVEFLGEVTIIEVSKTGFETALEAIPHAPAEWVRDQYTAMIIGIISAVVGSIATYILQSKRKR